jgi:hypothetical protein
MQVHAEPTLCAGAYRCTLSSQYRPSHADTCRAVIVCRGIQMHAQLFTCRQPHADTCRAYTVCRGIQMHAQLLTCRPTPCRYMQSRHCVQGHTDARSALNTDQHMLIHAEPSLCAGAYRCAFSSRHADTRWALNTCRGMQVHARILTCRNACRYTPGPGYAQAHEDTCQAQEAGPCMHIHSQFSICRNACRYTLGSGCGQAHEDARQAQDAGQCIQVHARLSIRSRHMLTHAHLLIQANIHICTPNTIDTDTFLALNQEGLHMQTHCDMLSP